jgi:spore maturation protein CgeB
MRVVMFYHSIVSDWNHGNAHFLRGVATELLARGHEVAVYEPKDGWSVTNLLREKGPDRAQRLARHGRQTIMARHTCGHRIDQLMRICRELGISESRSG